MSSDLLREMDPIEAEKEIPQDDPPIPFVPQKRLITKETKTVSMPLRVDPNDKSATHKQSFPVVSEMTIEELFEWRDSLWQIITYTPVTGQKAKFDTAKLLLADQPLADWKQAEKDMCDTETKKDDGTVIPKRGQTSSSFKATLKVFIAKQFPSTMTNPARVQKDYIRYIIKVPDGLSIKVASKRLQTLSNKCGDMPGQAAKPLDEDELCAILGRMVKPKYLSQFKTQHAGKRDALSFQEHVEYFEQLETNEAINTARKKAAKASAKKTAEKDGSGTSSSGGDARKGKSRGGKNNKNNRGPHKGPAAAEKRSGKKWCGLCEQYGGKPETHWQSKCTRHTVNKNGGFDRNRDSGNSRRDKKEYSHTMEELYMVNRKLEKKLKKKKRSRYMSDSESGSDSD